MSLWKSFPQGPMLMHGMEMDSISETGMSYRELKKGMDFDRAAEMASPLKRLV